MDPLWKAEISIVVKKGIFFYVLSVILYLLHNYTGIVWITIGYILYQSNKQKK